MMMGSGHCAVAHLELVRGNPGMAKRVQDVLPQPGRGPSAELAEGRRPLAELIRNIPPRRPVRAIQKMPSSTRR